MNRVEPLERVEPLDQSVGTNSTELLHEDEEDTNIENDGHESNSNVLETTRRSSLNLESTEPKSIIGEALNKSQNASEDFKSITITEGDAHDHDNNINASKASIARTTLKEEEYIINRNELANGHVNSDDTPAANETVTEVKGHVKDDDSAVDGHMNGTVAAAASTNVDMESGSEDEIWPKKAVIDSEEDMSGGSRCCFGVMALLVQILLHGELALTLYWIVQYRWNGLGFPFSFMGSEQGEGALDKEWNLHPVMMIAGFIYCMGQAMLVYRSCRCCQRIWSKLLHTMFHLLAIPCIVIGFIAAWNFHENQPEGRVHHLYSIHSWMGLATMGMFLMQFISGMFSFLLLMCCSTSTASCRSSMVPIHSSLGTTTFLMAIATCIAGITETALFKLSNTGLDTIGRTVITELGGKYMNFDEEAIFLNTMGAILIGLAILVPCILGCEGFRKGLPREGEDDI